MKEIANQKINNYLQKIDLFSQKDNSFLWEKYAQLGSKIVKLICYSKDFVPLIEKQLSYSLKNDAKNHDATIILWHEKSPEYFLKNIIDEQIKLRLRVDQLVHKTQEVGLEIIENNLTIKVNNGKEGLNYFEVFDSSYSKHNSLIKACAAGGIINAFDRDKNIYYYGVKDLHPEEFIKQGHIFVQIFNKIIKSKNTNLVHAALVGLDNNGILLCAKGQKGKSTLAVLAMMQGFDYVSDDYLVLEKEGDELYSYPIYSIITLSPKMYNELYDDLKGKFVSNNARRDKYVIDISAYHQNFRKKYPVKICMFPQIVNDEKPSIVACKKGSAITQLVHSTISQMDDKHDIKTIQKLISFVKDFDFYQINLCANVRANVDCLKQFSIKINQKKYD